MNILLKLKKFRKNPYIVFTRLAAWKLMNWLDDWTYLKLYYRGRTGKPLRLKKPQTFTEKIQWLKLNDRKPIYTTMVDKYAVKQYVAERIGEQYIIPTLGVWNNVEEIDWKSLPSQFVLKCTHDSGGLVICKDKEQLDIKAANKKLQKAMKRNFWKYGREWPYKDVERRIIAEKYMEDATPSSGLTDYKFFCFDGQPLYCQVIRDRQTAETIDFYDMDWNLQKFVGLNPAVSNGSTPVARPRNLDKMKVICQKLAKDMSFVRVDLYEINDSTYFGEITLYPASGFGQFTPEDWNGKLGELIGLPQTGGVNS